MIASAASSLGSPASFACTPLTFHLLVLISPVRFFCDIHNTRMVLNSGSDTVILCGRHRLLTLDDHGKAQPSLLGMLPPEKPSVTLEKSISSISAL